MVSTQDSESCDPSSNLGGTYIFYTFPHQGEFDNGRYLLFFCFFFFFYRDRFFFFFVFFFFNFKKWPRVEVLFLHHINCLLLYPNLISSVSLPEIGAPVIVTFPDNSDILYISSSTRCWKLLVFSLSLTWMSSRTPNWCDVVSTLRVPLDIKSILVISNSNGLSEILRDIRTSTYQIYRNEEKLIRLTTFNKYMCHWTRS